MKPPVDQRYCTGFAIASGYKTSEYARVEFGAGSESERNTRARYCLIPETPLTSQKPFEGSSLLGYVRLQ
jgi:hypothetical protein